MQHTQFSNIDNLFPKYWKLFFEILKKSDSIKEESKINGFINLEKILLEWEMTVIHNGRLLKQGILPESRIGVTVENYLSKIELPLVDCSERLKQLLVSQLKLERDKVVRPEDLFISTFQNVDALSGKIFAGNFNGKELSGLNDISILGEIKEEIINSKIREILHKSIIEKIGENCSIEKNMGVIKEIKATPRNVEPFLVQNWHFVMLNHGKIITNSHKLDINTGRVNLNTGFIGKNHGLVEKNNGVIQTNVALSGKKGGTVKGGKGLIVDYYNGEVINFISVGGNIKNDYKTMNEYEMVLQSVNLKKDDLLADIREARKNEKSIDEYIVDKYRISENVLREALRFSLKDKFYEFKPKPDKQLIENFVIRAKKFFVKNLILPIAIYPHKAVFVTDDPSNPKRFTAIEELKRIKKDIFADKEIEIQKALWIDILKYINSFSAKPNTAQKTHELSMASKIESIDISVLEQELYDDKTKKEPINLLKSQKNSLNKFSLELREAPDEETKGDTVFNIEELIEEAKGSEIIELANNIILDGILDGASDIHIDPSEKLIKILFRIDGVLEEYGTISKSFLDSLVSRLKIMARLDISERRLPQDGKIKLTSKQLGDFDIRIATAKAIHGEKITMRILHSGDPLLLEQLNLSIRNLQMLKDILTNKWGMFLVTGATGSGKSTTLYSVIRCLIDNKIGHIVTAEDPVEKILQNVNQFQVNQKINLTFSKLLRSFLRQDPDVIMVGEIRDRETAEIALEASLTGHLLMSTLHTNSAAETFSRLLEMGIESFLVGSQLLGVLNQRLVRRLCPECTVQTKLDDLEYELFKKKCGPDLLKEYQEQYKFSSNTDLVVYKERTIKNCPTCSGRGFKGRIGIHELIASTKAVKSIISGRRQEEMVDAILETAITEGTRTLEQDAIEKVLQKSTSFAEVIRATGIR